MTQSHLNDVLNAVINQYTGHRIAYPGVELGQCPAPVCYFLQGLGCPTPSMFADRADGWGVHFPGELTSFFRHEVYQTGKAYPEGTILMWDSPHIAIVISSNGSNSVKVFEQNADPDGAPCHVQNRLVKATTHNCTYALIPIVTASAPVTPPSVVHPYTIQLIDPKQVQINKNTHEWTFNYDNVTAIENNPVANVNQGEIKTVVAILHHNIGMSYYLENAGIANGYNVVDCTDYTPPVATPVPVTPVLTTSIPMSPTHFSQGNYIVIKPLLGYGTSNLAANHLASSATVPAGTYAVFNKASGMINVSRTAGQPGWWINPTDNVPDPEPVAPPIVAPPIPPAPPKPENVGTPPTVNDWRETYKPILATNQAVKYIVNASITVHDYSTIRPDIHLTAGKEVGIFGTFTYKGVLYGRPKAIYDETFQFWFGIPMRLLTFRGSMLDNVLDAVHITKTRIQDDAMRYIDFLPRWFNKKK